MAEIFAIAIESGIGGGEQQPLLSVAVKLAKALDISLAQLSGGYAHDLDLEGTWWAGWETSKDGEPWVAIQEVKVHQHGSHLQLTAERTRPVEEGGYSWTGELRLWDQEALMGWYRGSDCGVQAHRKAGPTMTDIVDLTITAPNADLLADHTRNLIEERLAACGNIIPTIRSLYRWQGKVEDEAEAYVVLHTRAEHVPAIIERTNAAHPYDTVHILATTITAADPQYRQWVIDETRRA